MEQSHKFSFNGFLQEILSSNFIRYAAHDDTIYMDMYSHATEATFSVQ